MTFGNKWVLFSFKLAKGFIIAPHKKHNFNNFNNNLGITLLRCFGKLFTIIVTYKLHTQHTIIIIYKWII